MLYGVVMQLIQSRVSAVLAQCVLTITFMCMLSAVPAAQAQDSLAPQEIAGERYYAAFPLSITVDGSFQDWTGVPKAQVADGPQPAPDPTVDGSLTFAVAADMENLYLWIDVVDANIVSGMHGVEYWFEDSVEIYINTTGEMSRTSYAPGVVQINIPAINVGRPISETVVAGINSASVNTRAVVVKTDRGYAIEAAVPLVSSVWQITPQNGGALGFNIQLNGATELDRDIKLSWSVRDRASDQSYQNPSVFGRLEFYQIAGSTLPTAVPTVPALTAAPPTVAAPPTQAAPPDVSTPGGIFEVRGSTIYDPAGNPFVAKGVNVSGSNWVWTRPTASDADQIVDCWNFNLVRVNSFLFRGEQPWQQYDVNNDLEQIVRAFTERGVVVVFEAHDRIGGYYQGGELDQLVSWFTDLATRYRDNPYVWFDVMNEPGGRNSIDVDNWLNVHRSVIRAIRETAGNNNIIIVEGAHGGQDAGNWESGPVPEENSAILQYADEVRSFDGQTYGNIVFSIHPYDQWNSGDARMADFFDRVLAQDLALIVGEYGVQTNADTRAATQSIFNTAVPRNIGRIVWHWDGGDDNDLTQNTSQGGGWEIDNCQSPTNLSWLGNLVWQDNHS